MMNALTPVLGADLDAVRRAMVAQKCSDVVNESSADRVQHTCDATSAVAEFMNESSAAVLNTARAASIVCSIDRFACPSACNHTPTQSCAFHRWNVGRLEGEGLFPFSS